MKPTVILDPHPRSVSLLFSKEQLKGLRAVAKLQSHDGERMPGEIVERHLPQAVAVVGQTDLPRERLEAAGKLRAIINVEGNFRQNIDYDYCFEHGIHVLNAGLAYAPAVAEMGIGLALSLARRIPEHDGLFRDGKEIYGRASNASSYLLRGKRVGLIGFGNLGRALLPLLRAFCCRVSVYDPWLPESLLREEGVEPAALNDLLRGSRLVFVLAGATSENRAMLGRSELNLLPEDAGLILLSRASLVNFDALTEHLKSRHFSAAIDVFPDEPLAPHHPIRTLPNVLLSAHRAGGIAESYEIMGQIVSDDLKLVIAGLPPVRLQEASRETVGRMESKPVG